MFAVKAFEPRLVKKSKLCGLLQWYDVDENATEVETRMQQWLLENKIVPILIEKHDFAYRDFVMLASRFCVHYKDHLDVTK